MPVLRLGIPVWNERHRARNSPAQSRVSAKAGPEAGRRFVDSSVNRRRNPVTRRADSTVAEGHIYDFGLFAIGKNGDGKVGARELKNKGRNSRQADKQVLCCISKGRFDAWKRDT